MRFASAALLVLLALSAVSPSLAQGLPTIRSARYVDFSDPDTADDLLVRRFVFAHGEPFDFVVRIMAVVSTDEGAVNHRALDMSGRVVSVPAELLAVREGLLAAKAYTDARGLPVPFNASRPLPAILEFNEGSDTLGTASWDSMTFNVDYGPTDLFATALHEWFHIVQRRSLRLPYSGDRISKLAIEGTATWFEDQPIPLNAAAQRLAGGETPDAVNSYYSGRSLSWFTSLSRGLFRASGTRFDPYRSVFFWKHYSDRVAGLSSDAQLSTITDTLKRISAGVQRGTQPERVFSEVIGAALPGSGSGRRTLRSHWANFLATNIQQTAAGPRGFGDEGVPGYCCPAIGAETARVDRLHDGHYGFRRGARPPIEAEVAVDDDEIARRLDAMPNPHRVSIEPFAMHLFALTLPGAEPGTPAWNSGVRNRPGDPELAGVTRLFVQVVGQSGQADDWVAAAVTQSHGPRDARGRDVEFLAKAFAIEPRSALGGKSAARTRVRWFGRKTPAADVERLWLGVANLSLAGREHEVVVQTVVTPFFEPSYGEEAGEDPRGTRTIRFVSSEPERDENRFRPGDRLTLEIDASDALHRGNADPIPEMNRTLELEVKDSRGAELAVEDVEVRATNPAQHVYQIAFTLPEEITNYGEARAEIILRSFLKLGVGDRNDEELTFELARIPPEVTHLKVEHGGSLLFERAGEAFRPIPPGASEVTIGFDRAMDTRSAPRVRLLTPVRRLIARGDWLSETEWKGRIELPTDASYDPMRGFATLEVSARSAEGEELDADPEEDEAQPDTATRLLVGGRPPILEELRVLADGEQLYRGRWTGRPDLEALPSWAHAKVDEATPRLETEIEDVPREGNARIELVFSNPLREAPRVTVGSLAVAVEAEAGDARRYAGSFSLEEAHQGLGQGAVLEVEVDATDEAGNQLDADPRTLSLIGTDEAHPWTRYESLAGARPEGTGGPDRWHGLATPPRMSLVIILDLSGSMEGDRLASAKQAIQALLNQLPHSVELALVTFNGCTPSSIGFTRDMDAVRGVIAAATASGGTGYAAALNMARDILATKTHPSSVILKYAPFSDGDETCDGDPVAAIDALEALIAEGRGEPSPVPEIAAAAEDPQEEIPCDPGEWEIYEARVRHGGLHLDGIRLVETRRQERRMADGHCQVTVLEESYSVSYGQLDDQQPHWRISSRASSKRSLQASSRDSDAQRQKVERLATRARANGTNLATSRLRIERAVRESLARSHRSAHNPSPAAGQGR